MRTLPVPAPARVLACGAWLKNTACLLDGDRVWSSPLHGDLSDPAARGALLDSVARLQQRASGPIEAVAHDLHPDFFSTEVALQLAARLGVPAVAVQHHHAHIAVLQAENGAGAPLVGLALDGVGLGTDGVAWGGELLWVDGARFERLAHLPELALPGGDVAAREPWRMAASALHRLGRGDEIAARLSTGWVDAADAVEHASAARLATVLQRALNCPPTTGAGRWFDAAAGLLGVCARQHEEAQAAIALERLAAGWLATHPAPGVDDGLIAAGLNLDELMLRLLALRDAAGIAPAPSGPSPVGAGVPDSRAQGAALFHVALADALARAAIGAAHQRGVRAVALGGGCFFNRILRDRVGGALTQAGLQTLLPAGLNCGDAGLALGQAWVAAHSLGQGDRGTGHNFHGRAYTCV